MIRTNPDLPAKAFEPARLPARQHTPPRNLSFAALARGQAPLVYMPPEAYERPGVTRALRSMLTRHPMEGLASPDAWEDLLAATGLSAEVYVVDRQGERWRVLGVEWDPGGETGMLRVRHLGRMARRGDRMVDLQDAFGYMIPVVVYKPPGRGARRNPPPVRRNGWLDWWPGWPRAAGKVVGWTAAGATADLITSRVMKLVEPVEEWVKGAITGAGERVLGAESNPPAERPAVRAFFGRTREPVQVMGRTWPETDAYWDVIFSDGEVGTVPAWDLYTAGGVPWGLPPQPPAGRRAWSNPFDTLGGWYDLIGPGEALAPAGHPVVEDLYDHAWAWVDQLSRAAPDVRVRGGSVLRAGEYHLVPWWGSPELRRREPWRNRLMRAWFAEGDPAALRWTVTRFRPTARTFGEARPIEDLYRAVQVFVARVGPRAAAGSMAVVPNPAGEGRRRRAEREAAAYGDPTARVRARREAARHGMAGGPTEHTPPSRADIPLAHDLYQRALRVLDDQEWGAGRMLANQYHAIVENLLKKVRKGTYDPQKAPKLWGYWIDAVAKVMHRGPGPWHQTWPKPTRVAAAQLAAAEFERRLHSGEVVPNPVGCAG